MASGFVRIAQRYLIPNFLVSVYYSLRFRCFISTRAQVQLTGKIRFGKGTRVKAFSVIQTSGGQVVLGERCLVNNFVQIATGEADAIFGDDVRIGPGVIVGGSKRNYVRRDVRVYEQGYTHRGTVIGNDVHLGAGAVLFERKIGEGAIIGAGAVVTKDVEPYQVAAGVPARVIGERT